ncbi:PREDICTED: luciferin 4-monooxygenase-like [Trachymyrmex cornetzi]|uniref:luciferin 4-monooxygenase-like n=1 Tax=Trachymyrmex cornetzi TaxID=471704 RepID=UPI00084F170C|nr:PREDICTED: luciferin 4-monooxygenase-like [Trachymyrmex cornetzi]
MASKKPNKEINVLSGKDEIIHNINIGNMILRAFKSKPDFVGQINAVTEEQITYQQMRENSVKCALWLKQSHYKNITIVSTRYKMLEYIPFLASLYVGGIVNTWDDKNMDDILRIACFMSRYRPNVIFIDSHNYSRLKEVLPSIYHKDSKMNPPKIITFDRIEGVDCLESILNNDFEKTKIEEFSCVKMKPQDTVAITFSPSATNYSDSKVYIRCFAFTYPSNQEVPVMSSGEIGLWYASLNWSYGMILTVRCIISYVTVIKCSKFSDKNMYETIQKYKVSWIFLESKMCNQIFYTDIRMYDISSLKQLVIDDSAIYFSDAQKKLYQKFINVSIVQVYSIAKFCIIAAYQRNNQQYESSGYVAKNVQLMVLDIESKKPVGSNKAGTIWYAFVWKFCSPQTCKLQNCYNYKAKEDTICKEEYYINEWYCTQDYGYYKEDGEIYLIDKVKDLIKYRTYHLSPTRIENTLLQHPAVSEVVVLSVPHLTDGQHPVAYVKKECGAELSEVELMIFLETELPEIYQLRGGVHFEEYLPYLPNGKIDRMLVPEYTSLVKRVL